MFCTLLENGFRVSGMVLIGCHPHLPVLLTRNPTFVNPYSVISSFALFCCVCGETLPLCCSGSSADCGIPSDLRQLWEVRPWRPVKAPLALHDNNLFTVCLSGYFFDTNAVPTRLTDDFVRDRSFLQASALRPYCAGKQWFFAIMFLPFSFRFWSLPLLVFSGFCFGVGILLGFHGSW